MVIKQETFPIKWCFLNAIFLFVLCLSNTAEGQKSSGSKSNDICLSDECYRTADKIKENCKPGVKPCGDFYRFVCGGWQARNPVPPDQTRWNQFKIVTNSTNHRIKEILEMEDKTNDLDSLKVARKFYRSCLISHDNTEQNMHMFMEWLTYWGGWPMITDKWDGRNFDWQSLLVNLERSLIDFSSLFAVNLELDEKDSSRSIISIGQGALPFCPYVYLEEDQEYFGKLVLATAFEFALFDERPLSLEHLVQDTANVLNLTVEMCKFQKFDGELKDEFELYTPMTIRELQKHTDELDSTQTHSKINWLVLINNYLDGSSVQVNDDEVISVKDPEYLLKVIRFIDTVSKRDLANYMMIHKIIKMQKYLSAKLYDFVYNLDQETGGRTKKTGEWWQHCVEDTNDIFDHAIGYEYVKLYFDENKKEKATELAHLILDSFIDELENTDWMDKETRSKAVEKAKNIILVIGYPDWYKNISRINDLYSEISFNGTSYFVNLENAALGSIIHNAKQMRRILHRSEFAMGPAEINAGYFSALNVMSIPTGLFQQPFYIQDRPEALNYGAMGFIIGHELSHAFDVRGRMRDKNGNLVNWWTSNTLEKYLGEEECFKNLYNNYPVPELAGEEVTHLNGAATLNENMADNGGLHVAYQAYKKYVGHHGEESRLPGLSRYTSEQLFFVGYATIWCENNNELLIYDILSDDHSPTKYRVAITLGNSEEFLTAWQCTAPINLHKKCDLW